MKTITEKELFELIENEKWDREVSDSQYDDNFTFKPKRDDIFMKSCLSTSKTIQILYREIWIEKHYSEFGEDGEDVEIVGEKIMPLIIKNGENIYQLITNKSNYEIVQLLPSRFKNFREEMSHERYNEMLVFMLKRL